MSRTRLILLCLMATAAVSMVASASASATIEFWQCKKVASGKFLTHQCNSTGSGPEWETKQLGKNETFEVVGTSGTSTLTGSILSIGVTITCLHDTNSSVMEPGGKTKGKATFTGCSQSGLGAKCGVAEPIPLTFTDQLIGTQTKLEDEFKAVEPEEVFAIIEIIGSECTSKGKFKVKGTQTCKVLNPEASGTQHELECTAAGSKLKLGTSEATFTSTERFHEVKLWAWGMDP